MTTLPLHGGPFDGHAFEPKEDHLGMTVVFAQMVATERGLGSRDVRYVRIEDGYQFAGFGEYRYPCNAWDGRIVGTHHDLCDNRCLHDQGHEQPHECWCQTTWNDLGEILVAPHRRIS